MIRQKYQTVLGQIFIWTTAWVVISFVLTNGLDHPNRFFRKATPSVMGVIVIVWANLKYLLPEFYFKKKIPQFLLISVLLIATLMFIAYYSGMPWADWVNTWRGANSRPRRGIPLGVWMERIMPYVMAYLGSTLIEISRYATQKEKEAIQLQGARMETELKFLKSQINPHFLFNILNNIYTLTVIKSDKASENLLRLSDMLRYMLYDTNSGKVSLAKEITYLKNYVNLVGLKDSKGLNVTLQLDENYPDFQIAPLLFIPFVENAYKHSKIEDLQKGFIIIQLVVTDQHLQFTVENSVPNHSYSKDKVGGIGLNNIKKRLNLIYPNRHELVIKTDKGRYFVQLKLDVL